MAEGPHASKAMELCGSGCSHCSRKLKVTTSRSLAITFKGPHPHNTFLSPTVHPKAPFQAVPSDRKRDSNTYLDVSYSDLNIGIYVTLSLFCRLFMLHVMRLTELVDGIECSFFFMEIYFTGQQVDANQNGF